MQTCPDCGNSVTDTARFCDNCGHSFVSAVPVGAVPVGAAPHVETALDSVASVPPGTCSACGYRNIPGETFCQNCGVQLAPVASTPPPPPRPQTGPLPVKALSCPECGQATSPADIYCPNCGRMLAQPEASPKEVRPPAPPESAAQVVPAVAEEPPAAVDTPAVSVPQPTPSAAPETFPGGRLIVRESGVEIVLPGGLPEVIIGRSDPVRGVFPEVDLTPHGGDTRGVSRRHARLVFANGSACIEDLNSTNYTFLNRERIEPGVPYPIRDHDEIRTGLLALEYRLP